MLFEGYVTYSKPRNVNAQTGVIEGVKLLGWESKNKRRYPKEVVAKYVEAYRDRASYYAHANGERHFDDLAGNIINPRIEPDGLYGDVKVLMKDSRAGKLFEIAADMPHRIGMSHVAVGDGHYEDGTLVVDSITEVVSIDIVTDPATTNGLFESVARGEKMKVSVYLESLGARLTGNRAKWAKWLTESVKGTTVADAEIDKPATDDNAGAKAGLRAGVTKILDDPTLTPAERAKQVEAFARAESNILAATEPEPPAAEPTPTPPKAESVAKPGGETGEAELRGRLDRMERKERLTEYAGTLKFNPSKEAMGDYLLMPEEAARRAILRESQASAGPRMTGPGGGTPAGGGNPTDRAKNGKALKESVFSRN